MPKHATKTSFQKGHIPWIKGKIGGTAGSFKKGHPSFTPNGNPQYLKPGYWGQTKGKHWERRPKSEVHDKIVLEETKRLENEGWRVIPFSIIPKPDIICWKDGRIEAVEIDAQLKPKRYEHTKHYFDKITWIICRKKLRPTV